MYLKIKGSFILQPKTNILCIQVYVYDTDIKCKNVVKFTKHFDHWQNAKPGRRPNSILNKLLSILFDTLITHTHLFTLISI